MRDLSPQAKTIEIAKSNHKKESVEVLYENQGLCVHHVLASRLIPKDFVEQYFAVSHINSGAFLLSDIDGLSTAIACCDFLVEKSKEAGLNWIELGDISSIPREKEKDIRAVKNAAYEHFQQLFMI